MFMEQVRQPILPCKQPQRSIQPVVYQGLRVHEPHSHLLPQILLPNNKYPNPQHLLIGYSHPKSYIPLYTHLQGANCTLRICFLEPLSRSFWTFMKSSPSPKKHITAVQDRPLTANRDVRLEVPSGLGTLGLRIQNREPHIWKITPTTQLFLANCPVLCMFLYMHMRSPDPNIGTPTRGP